MYFHFPASLKAYRVGWRCSISLDTLQGHKLIDDANATGAGFNAAKWVGRTVKYYLDPVIQLIVSSGGDVVKFGGDSITAVGASDKLLESVQCCIDARRHVHNNPFRGPDGKVIDLAMRSVVHQGDLYVIHIGDRQGPTPKIETICYGPAFIQLCQSLDHAKKNCVLVLALKWDGNVKLKYVASSRPSSAGTVNIEFDIKQISLVKSSLQVDQQLILSRNDNRSNVRRAELLERAELHSAMSSVAARIASGKEIGKMSEILQMTIGFVHFNYREDD